MAVKSVIDGTFWTVKSASIQAVYATLDLCFSTDSLIIYQVKTKPVLISIDFGILLHRLLLSFCFDYEDISNTRDCFIGYQHT